MGCLTILLRGGFFFFLFLAASEASRIEAPFLFLFGTLGLVVAEWVLRWFASSGWTTVEDGKIARLRRSAELRERVFRAQAAGELSEAQATRILEVCREKESAAFREMGLPGGGPVTRARDLQAQRDWLNRLVDAGDLSKDARETLLELSVAAAHEPAPPPPPPTALHAEDAEPGHAPPRVEDGPRVRVREPGEELPGAAGLRAEIEAPVEEEAAGEVAGSTREIAEGIHVWEPAPPGDRGDGPVVDDLEPPPPEPGLVDALKANFMVEGNVQWAEALFTLFSLLAFATAVVTVGYSWARWNPYARFAALVAGAAGAAFFSRKVAGATGLEKTGRAMGILAFMIAPIALGSLPFLVGKAAGDVPFAGALVLGAGALAAALLPLRDLVLGAPHPRVFPLYLAAGVLASLSPKLLVASPFRGLGLLALVLVVLSFFAARRGEGEEWGGARLVRLAAPVHLMLVGLAAATGIESLAAGAWCFGAGTAGLLMYVGALEGGAGSDRFPALPMALQVGSFGVMGLALLASFLAGGFFGNTWLLYTAMPCLVASLVGVVRKGSERPAYASAVLLVMVTVLLAGPELGDHSTLVLIPAAVIAAGAMVLRGRIPGAARAYERAAGILVGWAYACGVVRPVEGLTSSVLLVSLLGPLAVVLRGRRSTTFLAGALASVAAFGWVVLYVDPTRAAAGARALGVFGHAVAVAPVLLALAAALGIAERVRGRDLEALLTPPRVRGWWEAQPLLAVWVDLLAALASVGVGVALLHPLATRAHMGIGNSFPWDLPGSAGIPGPMAFALGALAMAAGAFGGAERGARRSATLAALGLSSGVTLFFAGLGEWFAAPAGRHVWLALGLALATWLLAELAALAAGDRVGGDPGVGQFDPLPLGSLLPACAFGWFCWVPMLGDPSPSRGVALASLVLVGGLFRLSRGMAFPAWMGAAVLAATGLVDFLTTGWRGSDQAVAVLALQGVVGIAALHPRTWAWMRRENLGAEGATPALGTSFLVGGLAFVGAIDKVMWPLAGGCVYLSMGGTMTRYDWLDNAFRLLPCVAATSAGLVLLALRLRSSFYPLAGHVGVAGMGLAVVYVGVHTLPESAIPLASLGSAVLVVFGLDRLVDRLARQDALVDPRDATWIGRLFFPALAFASTLVLVSEDLFLADLPGLPLPAVVYQALAVAALSVMLASERGRLRAFLVGGAALVAGGYVVDLVAPRVDHARAAAGALGCLAAAFGLTFLTAAGDADDPPRAYRRGFFDASLVAVLPILLLVGGATWWEVADLWVAIAAAVPVLTAAHLLRLAVREDHEGLVYLAQAVAASTYAYLRVTGLLGVTMIGQVAVQLVAFALLGIGDRVREGRYQVFSRPFRNVSLVLPGVMMLRICFTPVDWFGFDGWGQFALGSMAAAFYALAAQLEGRGALRYVAGMAAYAGLALLFLEGYGLDDPWRHLDFYLVPLGLLVVLFSWLERENLLEEQEKTMRTVGLLLVYASPAAHALLDATANETVFLMVLGLLGAASGAALGIRLYVLYGLVAVGIGAASYLLNIYAMQPRNFALVVFTVLAGLFGGYSAWARQKRAELGLD